ncbi:MAG: TAXI family TRAP transporter solute-binding subunit [Pseudomonadota bacterium]
MRTMIAFVPALALLLTAAPGRAAEELAIVGDEDGKYYELGQMLCALVNRKADSLDCTITPVPAGDAAESFANLVNIRDGAGDIGIARSDWQHFAVTGTGPVRFMSSDFEPIRSLFSIDTRPFTLLAKRNAGIEGIDDLAGKRVNIGRPYSENRATMDLVMAAKDWTKQDFQLAEELAAGEQSMALCHGWVEAVTYEVGHPDSTIEQMTRICDAEIVPISDAALDKVIAETPYLAPMTIPGGIYEGVDEPVPTFGSTITVFSSSDVPEEAVYDLVATVFENLSTLKALYPELRHLEPEQMLKAGLSAPLHDGAKRYYSEQGMM